MIKRREGYRHFKPDPTDFKIQMYRLGGNVTAVAQYYNIDRDTVYSYFKRHPEMKDWREFCIIEAVEWDIDVAESTIRKCMREIDEDRRAALDAAKFVIDKRGHYRNYTNNIVDQIDKKLGEKIDRMTSAIERKQD